MFPCVCLCSVLSLERTYFCGGSRHRFWKTVHGPLFFRKIVEIERYVYGLPSCMRSKLLSGRGRFGRKPPPPPTTAIIPDARPLGTFENQDTVTVRLGISKRCHEKIGDCEQSRLLVSGVGCSLTVCINGSHEDTYTITVFRIYHGR